MLPRFCFLFYLATSFGGPVSATTEYDTKTYKMSVQSPNRVHWRNGLDLMDNFDLINQFLSRELPSEDGEENFGQIDKWGFDKLNWEQAKQLESDKMVRAIRLFRSLAQVGSSAKCDLNAYNILVPNWNAAFGLPEWDFGSQLAERRVNKIVKFYLRKHEIECRPRYFKLFRERYTQMDPTNKYIVESYVKNMFKQQFGAEEAKSMLNNSQKLFDFMLKHLFPVHESGAKSLPNSKFSESQVDVRSVDLARKLYDLQEEFVYEECKSYVMSLETVFMPALLSLRIRVLEGLSMAQVNDQATFHLSWLAFQLCDLFLADSIHSQVKPETFTEHH